MNYNTPLYDECLKELGYSKFENNPIYFIPFELRSWRIVFELDHKGYAQNHEKWLLDNKISKQSMLDMLKKGFLAFTTSTITEKLEYKYLLMLTADFYYHNLDTEKHKEYKEKYELLTGIKY